MGSKISGKDLIKLGFPQNNTINIGLAQIQRYRKREKKETILQEVKEVLSDPTKFDGHGIWGKLAESLIKPVAIKMNVLLNQRVPFSIFGEDMIDEQAKFQLYDALKLPIAVAGALMPDAHAGYGLPIGGVLATHQSILPYGVGVDIGCLMSMSIFDLPASFIKGKDDMLLKILTENTKFGMYETHKNKSDHELFYRSEFQEIPLLKSLKDKAYKQLGTSGGGNHFVEFGIIELLSPRVDWGVPPGSYLAILSHSGSRGLGANIAKHYTYLAKKQCPLPRHVQHLAWLDMNTHDGQEYWLAMNLAGDYAKICHENIHQRIAKALGKRILLTVENHHNFAWKEMVGDKECIVHRKGATPAGKGVLGIIPGSMTASGYLVEGLGHEGSLNSASHGAGRLYSRADAKNSFTKAAMNKKLVDVGVQVIGGSIDESPMVYKDIEKVMSFQKELVTVLGIFKPKFVRMES